MANLFDVSTYINTEPLTFTAGDRVAWARSDLGNDYSPSSYTLSYTARLEGSGSTVINLTAVASSLDYHVVVPAATSAKFVAGRYHWQMYIKRNSDSERLTLDSGTFIVHANKVTAITDPRSDVKITLDAIRATLAGRATKDQMGYSIAGRSISRIPIPDLLAWRDSYAADYAREVRKDRIKNGLGHSGIIKTRFV